MWDKKVGKDSRIIPGFLVWIIMVTVITVSEKE
jgi:hypothetical protein